MSSLISVNFTSTEKGKSIEVTSDTFHTDHKIPVHQGHDSDLLY